MPGLRLAQRRSHALLSALLTFRCHTNGFTNRDLRALTTELRGLQTGAVTPGQTTYDLRRLKARGLIARIRTATATPSPTMAYTPPDSLPACTTDSCPPDWPTSPTTTSHHPYAQLLAPTTTPSKTSAAQQDSPPDAKHPTHHVKLDSQFRLCPNKLS